MAEFVVVLDADTQSIVAINLDNVTKIAPTPDDDGTMIYFAEDDFVTIREDIEAILEHLNATVLLESD